METSESKACYFCGFVVNSSIIEHIKSCEAKKSKCNNYKKMGHYERVCRSKKFSELELDNLEQEIQQLHSHNCYDADIFNIDLLKINVSNSPTNNLKKFKAQVIINNYLSTVLIDTGEKVSACSALQATKWGFIEKIQLTQHKIKSLNSLQMSVKGNF